MSHSTDNLKSLCFVDMPFGVKRDHLRGIDINFDSIYDEVIKPVITAQNLQPLRSDEESSGGIIHEAMFARLLMAEFVIADLSTANANVFYELGIRHAVRPFTTILIYSNSSPPPFDVAMARAIPYDLTGEGTLSNSDNFIKALSNRLESAIHGTAKFDSPIFQLIPNYPALDLPHEVTEAFRDRVKDREGFAEKIAIARHADSKEERLEAITKLEIGLGEIKTARRENLVDLMLAYRSISAWGAMVSLCENLPDSISSLIMVRQQWALALNRRNSKGDRTHAKQILFDLASKHGEDPETLGILGRVHKDEYKDLKDNNSPAARSALYAAIDAYRKGFFADIRDYYPGINAVTLLLESGEIQAIEEAQNLARHVQFAVIRRGGLASSDYWDLATLLELACITNDWDVAKKACEKCLYAAGEGWMLETTCETLLLLYSIAKRNKDPLGELDNIIQKYKERMAELDSAPS